MEKESGVKLTDQLEKLKSDLSSLISEFDEFRESHSDSHLCVVNERLSAELKTEQELWQVEHDEYVRKYNKFAVIQTKMLKFTCFLPVDDGDDPAHHKHYRSLTEMPSVEAFVSFYELINEGIVQSPYVYPTLRWSL
jgi:hypothetical protein